MDMGITQAFNLEQAIQALESQRAILGDAVVDSAIATLRARKGATPAAAPESVRDETQQRRLLTVLFADVSGFTALSARLDAEDVRDMMENLWQRLDNIILTHGGRIDKHMGDGVMALWGIEGIREDDAERAIRAGLAMQAEIARFNESEAHAADIKMRIGVNTGPALFGQIGTQGEQTASGDAVTLAARLEQACPPGRILIAHDAYRHVRGIFDVEQLSGLEVKGKAEPMQTYLVSAAKPRALHLATRGVEGVETRMIGRTEEMERLQALYQRMAAENKMQVVTVVGDVGVGKSRLLYEFNAWADLLPGTQWWFKGRGALATMNAPYALLRDIFNFRFQISESDAVAVVRQKMENGFREFMPNDDGVVEKAHVVGHLIGLNFMDSPHLRGLIQDPRQLRQQALFYMRQFFTAAADQFPALMFLDDLQWADTGSLEALSNLSAHLPPATRIMIVGMARPALFERYPAWGAEVESHTRLDLNPLSKDDCRGLVEEILRKVHDLPAAVRELVAGSADGNPFYVEEMIKMLIENKVIQPGEDKWSVAPGKLAALEIPTTLTEVVQARLDSLSPAERSALQMASVVGRVFWDDAVSALTEPDERENVRAALASLRRKEIIFERKPSAFAGKTEYIFKQNLVYEVTYNTLLRRQRSAYHLKVAGWLEYAGGERRREFLTQIAQHYEQAGDLQKAVDILTEIGQYALSVSALSEARTTLERVKVIAAQDAALPRARSIGIDLILSEACFQMGDYPAAHQHADSALAAARAMQSNALQVDALVQLGFVIMTEGDYALAKTHYDQALETLLKVTGDRRAVKTRLLTGLATVEWRLGNLGEAEHVARQSYEMANEIKDTRAVLLALNRLGAIVGDLGRGEEEERCYKQALEIALEAGMRERVAATLNNLGAAYGERKDWPAAWTYYMNALDISMETGAQHSIAVNHINLGFAGAYLGKLAEAHHYLREGIRVSRAIRAAPITVAGVSYFGAVLLAEGNVARALAIFGACRKNPAYNSESEREIASFLDDWKVPSSDREAGFTKGEALDWEALLDELTT